MSASSPSNGVAKPWELCEKWSSKAKAIDATLKVQEAGGCVTHADRINLRIHELGIAHALSQTPCSLLLLLIYLISCQDVCVKTSCPRHCDNHQSLYLRLELIYKRTCAKLANHANELTGHRTDLLILKATLSFRSIEVLAHFVSR